MSLPATECQKIRLQNQVDPHSQLHAISARGIFMGNRGSLHNSAKQILRQRTTELRWITCTLAYEGPKRTLMTDNSYTELFFLDEPTAYAAGHRPCFACRRAVYNRFKEVWHTVFPDQKDLSAPAIDRLLHAARLNADGSQSTWNARLVDLPDGTIVEHAGDSVLLWRGQQLLWSFAGYTPLQMSIKGDVEVSVLTPEPLVRLFAAGLAETLEIHPSASSLSD